MSRALAVVLPAGVDDPAAPSGGNTYDRRVCDGLRACTAVREIPAAGAWPDPDPAARAALAGALAALPDGATVLLDGLVGGAVPELLEAQAGRLRCVLLVHLPLGDETGLEPGRARRLAAAERRSVHAAAAVVTTSAAAARRVAALHGVDPAAVHVAPPGVDPAPPAEPSAAGDRLLCVAAVVPRKGHDVLADALERIADRPWRCVCVGALDRSPGFAAAVRDRVPAGRVQFCGPLAGADLAARYAAADLLVLPSRAETYGMVVTEALAAAVPVLGTRVDGVPEALGCAPDGTVPGILVAPGDPAALAAALRAWLDEPRLRARLRAAARGRRATLHGWDETVRRLGEVVR